MSHDYGPNQPETHPVTINVQVHLGGGRFEERDIPWPAELEAQWKAINDLAFLEVARR